VAAPAGVAAAPLGRPSTAARTAPGKATTRHRSQLPLVQCRRRHQSVRAADGATL